MFKLLEEPEEEEITQEREEFSCLILRDLMIKQSNAESITGVLLTRFTGSTPLDESASKKLNKLSCRDVQN